MARADTIATARAEPATKVFRRKVFYVPGYDPIHPRRYRELYRKEGAEQAAITGYSIELKAKQSALYYGWQVTAQVGGQKAEADFDVLVWSDIVRDSMSNTIPATYLQLARTAWAYIGSGALFRLMRLRKGPVIAALYPIVFLLAQLVFACLLGWAIGALVASMTQPLLGLIAGLAQVPFVLRWFKAHDNKVFAYYLMHDYAYSAQSNGAYPPQLERRISDFATTIRAALAEDVDEVLVVGHSSGAHLSVSILADILRKGLPGGHPALAFLSLGQVVPMVSFLPRATRLRADLAYLSAQPGLTWVDVTAPGDGCAFALCDPVAVSGVAQPGKRWPLVLSAAFSQTLSAERWQSLRWRFFRLHFQYLCAFDRPGDYDYFQITAGPQPLAQRYQGRAPSNSRIEKPVNRHVSQS